jgi:hypothetical protein
MYVPGLNRVSRDAYFDSGCRAPPRTAAWPLVPTWGPAMVTTSRGLSPKTARAPACRPSAHVLSVLEQADLRGPGIEIGIAASVHLRHEHSNRTSLWDGPVGQS